jgi:hypothetical protein
MLIRLLIGQLRRKPLSTALHILLIALAVATVD